MRWTPGERSRNIEDRRGQTVRRVAPIGCGGLLLLLALTFLTGQDFLSLVPQDALVPTQAPAGPVRSSPEEEETVQFVSFVIDDLQDTWARVLPGRYREAKLVLFRDLVESACGYAQSATGPFYCPADQRVYLDLGFFDELRRRFGAPGDFAQAYVIAHEVGHHVQRLLGIDQQVRRMQEARPDLANQLSVRLELQADCFAGVWGNSTAQRQILERGDIEEGLNAAAAIGDDRIQRMSGSFVRPDAFTHGSSAQRVEWFRRGLESGDPNACDTFGGTN
jgi:predicted metalloprotease